MPTAEYVYDVKQIVNDSLIIVKKTRHEKNNQKAYEVQSIMYPNAPTYIITEYGLKKGSKDSYMRGKRIFEGNSLYSIEKVRPYLIDVEFAKTIAPQSHTKINLKCPDCDYKNQMTADKLVNRGFYCPLCDKNTPYPELFFMSYLEVKGINFEYQKIFNSLKSKKFDFYIQGVGVCETHGEQHYAKDRESSNWDYNKTQQSDIEKKQWCKENTINYIEIDCRESSFKHIKKSINNCEFLPNITTDDEKEILKQIEKNKRHPSKEIINDYKKGFNVSEIAKKHKVSNGVITNILKRNNIQLRENPTSYPSKKVRCITTGDIFPSVSKAVKWAEKSSKIAMACRGERKTAGEHPETGEQLQWEYIEE